MSQLSAGYMISKRVIVVLILLVLTLVTLNAILVIQNRKLRDVGTISTRSIVLKEGTDVPALSGLDLDGKKITLNYQNDARKAVMLIFSPRCTYCIDNMPNWQSIAQHLDRKQY